MPSESEFHQAISRRSDQWYGACLRITRSPDLARDAMQDGLLNAWRKRRQFEGGAQLETWIHRICVNSALSLVRASHPERWAPLDMDVSDETPTPDHLLHSMELDDQLQGALYQLSDMERVCFVLKHLEQWRIKEIAGDLNISIGNAKQAVFRATRKLRVSMAGLRSAS